MLLSLLAGLAVQHGAFVLTNGGEVTTDQADTFAKLCGGKNQPILVISMSLALGDRDSILASLKKQGMASVLTLDREKLLDRNTRFPSVRGVVLYSGETGVTIGANERDWFQSRLNHLIEEGGTILAIGPCASVVGTTVIQGDILTPGMGLIDGIIATEYYTKHRELPLRNAFFGSKVELGLGLDRGDWVVIRDGNVEKKVGTPHFILREAR